MQPHDQPLTGARVVKGVRFAAVEPASTDTTAVAELPRESVTRTTSSTSPLSPAM